MITHGCSRGQRSAHGPSSQDHAIEAAIDRELTFPHACGAASGSR